MSERQIAVTIFEDNRDLREGMQFLLNATPGFVCTGGFPNCSHLVDRIQDTKPEVVLMDIQMPGISGIEAVAILHNEFPELPVMIQTIFEDESVIFAAICAGANGYILKNTPPAKFLDCIKEVAEGGSPMTPSIATKVLKMFKEHTASPPTDVTLTLSNREKEILTLLADGLSYKLIGGALSISYETVHSHMKKIYQKLHVNSAGEAISKALKHKLV